MTIEEAIAHCYDVAKGKDNQCDDCKNEHLQLAKWLEENKRMKELLKQAVEDLSRLIDLNDNEKESIKTYSQGEALFVCGNRRMRINVVLTQDELDSFGSGGGL